MTEYKATPGFSPGEGERRSLEAALIAPAEAIRAGVGERVAPRVRAHAQGDAAIGFGLRLCQLYFAITILAGLAYAFALPPAAFTYDATLVYALAQMTVAALSIWLIQKRARLARPFVVIGSVLCAGLWAVDLFALGAFDTLVEHVGARFAAPAVAAQFGYGLMVIAYLAFSRTARARLSVALDRAPQFATGHSWDVPLRRRVRTWPFWRDLMIYFIIFSFLGHWAEMWFCYNIYLGVFMGDYDFSQAMLWSQWLFPYTAEGVAIVAIALILHPAKEALLKRMGGRVLPALVASIALTALVCTAIDFTCGMIANRDYSLWDYRALPFNFMGQVCLQNSTVYTVAATLIVWVFYPLMDRGLRRLPSAGADALFVGLLAVYAFCALLHFMYLTPSGLVVGV